ncbi:hypothetical protein T459_35175 [Capsicum annuum]|uniref:Uncharacterized protein n=1 Tax=Capsicum annuum TaxID=4072 RepID=A0A2G2XTX0_CAPAN|nr:hypothetical protein T459_35175 [Capsicum annuum]
MLLQYLDDKSQIKDAVRMVEIGLTSAWTLDDFKVAIAKYISSPPIIMGGEGLLLEIFNKFVNELKEKKCKRQEDKVCAQFGTVTQLPIHPASPVLLTKNGLLGALDSLAWLDKAAAALHTSQTNDFHCHDAMAPQCLGDIEPLSHGAFVPWCHGALVPLCHDALLPGAMVPWCLGATVPWCTMLRCDGASVPCCLGAMVPWCLCTMVRWYHGAFVPWFHGALVPTALGYLGAMVPVHGYPT